jgi:hypothetical protein
MAARKKRVPRVVRCGGHTFCDAPPKKKTKPRKRPKPRKARAPRARAAGAPKKTPGLLSRAWSGTKRVARVAYETARTGVRPSRRAGGRAWETEDERLDRHEREDDARIRHDARTDYDARVFWLAEGGHYARLVRKLKKPSAKELAAAKAMRAEWEESGRALREGRLER